ncbi:MAG: hypothetical protein ACLUOI_39350, partial [Eisenbergiella sp.]
LFTAVGGLISRIYGDSYGISRDKIPFLLCCSAVLIAMTVLPFLQRSLRCRMYEVEAAAKMSSGKLMASWIVFAGIGDGIGLSVLIFLTVRITPLGYGSAVLYLVVPFLSAAAVLFYLLGHLEWRHVLPGSVSACAVLLLVFGIFSKYCPAFYLQSFTAGWAVPLPSGNGRQYSRLHGLYRVSIGLWHALQQSLKSGRLLPSGRTDRKRSRRASGIEVIMELCLEQ